MPAILWLFFTPFISSLIILALPSLPQIALKRIAIVLSLIPLAFLLFNHQAWLGSYVDFPWLPSISINFHLSIDALSLLFVYLTAVVVPVSLFAVNSSSLNFPKFFYLFVLLLQGLLFGFFMARDLALFTIFWEAMLLPLYFIISLWGGPKREVASLKFLIYMIAGSVLMVAAVLSLYFAVSETGQGTFSLDALAQISGKSAYAPGLLAIFLLAFAVKTPLFPFHAWLPDTYYQAPASGTILLAGLLSKAGIYGILRVGMELFPGLLMEWSPWLLGLSIAGVFYGGLAAWAEKDYKRLIAYSSFSHVNFILAGLFVFSNAAQSGAILQALNHGITIAALFLVAGWLEERLGSTALGNVRGLAQFMPQLCWLTLFFVLSSVGLPGMNNFIGEVLILFGLFGENRWLAAFLGLSIILSVMYMLRWMQKVYFEEPTFFQDSWKDIRAKELAMAFPLIVLILWIGIYPLPVLNQIKPEAAKISAAVKTEEA